MPSRSRGTSVMNNAQETQWNKYLEAWAAITSEHRKALLDQSVSASCCFTDPDTEVHGLGAFTTHIEKFQEQFPGAYFRTNKFIEHHGQSVAEWMMHNKDGSEFLPGTSVARYGQDGKMTHIAGFWKL